eukprot:1003251-Pelagomonas_calceolata.AAC.2
MVTKRMTLTESFSQVKQEETKVDYDKPLLLSAACLVLRRNSFLRAISRFSLLASADHPGRVPAQCGICQHIKDQQVCHQCSLQCRNVKGLQGLRGAEGKVALLFPPTRAAERKLRPATRTSKTNAQLKPKGRKCTGVQGQ